MAIELPALPYDRTALEPHISGETIDFHYGKHHQAYVTNLNNLIAGTEFADMQLEDIVRKSQGGMFNNAAQVWNHSFYWNCRKPNGGGDPAGKLAEAINAAFGSFDSFKEQFAKAAATRFGSGWAWLCVKEDKSLCICSSPNQDNPLMKGVSECAGRPILGLDVWEHAYYLKYQNRRPDYVTAFWNVVNWGKVAELYAATR